MRKFLKNLSFGIAATVLMLNASPVSAANIHISYAEPTEYGTVGLGPADMGVSITPGTYYVRWWSSNTDSHQMLVLYSSANTVGQELPVSAVVGLNEEAVTVTNTFTLYSYGVTTLCSPGCSMGPYIGRVASSYGGGVLGLADSGGFDTEASELVPSSTAARPANGSAITIGLVNKLGYCGAGLYPQDGSCAWYWKAETDIPADRAGANGSVEWSLMDDSNVELCGATQNHSSGLGSYKGILFNPFVSDDCPGFEVNTYYKWKVRAKLTSTSDWGEWSSVSRFRVVPNDYPVPSGYLSEYGYMTTSGPEPEPCDGATGPWLWLCTLAENAQYIVVPSQGSLEFLMEQQDSWEELPLVSTALVYITDLEAFANYPDPACDIEPVVIIETEVFDACEQMDGLADYFTAHERAQDLALACLWLVNIACIWFWIRAFFR